MAVPKQRQLFLEGTRAVGHAFEPVVTHLLNFPDLVALDFLDHLAAFFGLGPLLLLGLGGILVGPKHALDLHVLFGARRVGLGPTGCGRPGIGNLFEIDEEGHGVGQRQGGQFFNLLGSPAKTGAAIEVRGGVITPLRSWQWLQHN